MGKILSWNAQKSLRKLPTSDYKEEYIDMRNGEWLNSCLM